MHWLVANALVLGLLILVVVPIFVASAAPRARVPIGIAYLAVLLAIVFHDFHWPSASDRLAARISPSSLQVSPDVRGQADIAAACEEALKGFERAGIIIDRSNPSRVIVADRPWSRLAQPYRDALTFCLKGKRQAESETPFEIVPQ